MNIRKYSLLVVLLCTVLGSAAQKSTAPRGYTIDIDVSDRDTREPIIMATVQLRPTGIVAVTDMDGHATLRNVETGDYHITISYVGYEPVNTSLHVSKPLNMKFQMTPTTLALKEVSVTARQRASGASTSSVISRQAIDHLQAASLADVMQLIPGQLMGNTDLTSQSNLQLRTLVNNNTSAFGSSIVVDGVPISNNGALTQGPFSGTSFTGTDLRQIAADDIQEVEIVRGIPSAEYGDLTSGLVVVRSKTGITPWQVKGKVTPELMNYSLGKGFRLDRAGVLNVSADYAQAWGDPRQKTRSYHRYTINAAWGYDLSRHWHIDTKLRLMHAKDWSGNDPDAIQDGNESKAKNTTLGLTHNGRLSLEKSLARTLSYTLGMTFTRTDNRNTSYVATSTGLLPILTARETGYYDIPWLTTSYQATGITESRPGSVYLKASDAFYARLGNTMQHFKAGVEYHYDWNDGRGYYNADEERPLKPNENGRPRAFSDVPGLHQLAAYAEDNFSWNINKVNRLRINFGLRFTSLQPFSDLATTALSPRLNVMLTVANWLDLRGGIGLNSKTPGLNYLYPDRKYDDRVAASYLPQDDTAAQLLNYHTQVYQVERSKELKNATTTKIEAGADIKLPGNRRLSLVFYHDKTPNGFGAATEYFTYASSVFDTSSGLIVTPGAATTIDFSHPARTDLVFMTTGKIGNTSTTVNKGFEFDCDLGEVKALRTTVHFSGAWSETKTWSSDLNSTSVRAALLPASYAAYGLTPFKVIYPSEEDYSRYRRWVNTLRLVTHIPQLRMVASLTGQVIWHNSSWSYTADKAPTGWIGTDLVHHDLTADMLNGYLTMDGQYHSTKPAEAGIALQDLLVNPTDNEPAKSPVTWNLSARLTKELGNVGSLSFYVNNALFYEPFLEGNNTRTLSQRNTGTFSFGAELSFNL